MPQFTNTIIDGALIGVCGTMKHPMQYLFLCLCETVNLFGAGVEVTANIGLHLVQQLHLVMFQRDKLHH